MFVDITSQGHAPFLFENGGCAVYLKYVMLKN
jgi:hypothetical protein